MDGRMLGGEHLGSPVRSPERTGEFCIRPLCLDSPLCPKVAALPRYVIRIPPIDPESDKSQFLYYSRLWKFLCCFTFSGLSNLPELRSILFSFVRRQAHGELCNCHCNTEAGRKTKQGGAVCKSRLALPNCVENVLKMLIYSI